MALTSVQSGEKLHNHTSAAFDRAEARHWYMHVGSNCRPENPQEHALSETLKCQRIQEL